MEIQYQESQLITIFDKKIVMKLLIESVTFTAVDVDLPKWKQILLKWINVIPSKKYTYHLIVTTKSYPNQLDLGVNVTIKDIMFKVVAKNSEVSEDVQYELISTEVLNSEVFIEKGYCQAEVVASIFKEQYKEPEAY